MNVDSIVPILGWLPIWEQQEPFKGEKDLAQVLAYILKKYKNVGVVVSTDLSHYLPYQEAMKIDNQTIEFVKEWIVEYIVPERACGYLGLRSYIYLTNYLNLDRNFVIYLNSGDTSGMKENVVGYTSFVS